MKNENTFYSLQLEGGSSNNLQLSSRIRSIHVHSKTGQSSSMRVQIALPHPLMQEITVDSLPKLAQLNWENRTYFKGEATKVQLTGHSQLEITYQDALHRVEKMFKETQTKQQKLKTFLELLVSDLKDVPQVRFFSPDLFDEELPTFSLGYRTVREILDELAAFYGFTFFIRHDQSRSALCFLRTGNSINTQPITIPWNKVFEKPLTSHNVQWKYDKVTVGLTDGMGEDKRKALRSESLKKPLKFFDAGEKMKRGFEIELSELDIHVSHPDLYARAERILPYQYSSKNSFSDHKQFIWLEPGIQVGDCIQTKDSFCDYQNEANYLIHETLLKISSSQPKLEVTAVRP